MREFEKRNPNLKVFNAVMHLDEATPHLHINFVPVCYGQKQGLSTRVSMKRAIQQMGFTASGKKETEAILWGSSEREKLTEILNNHNIVRQVVGAFHDHKSVEEYKRYAQIIDSKNAHINALKKENPVDLSSTDVGEILNQNDFLRDAVTRKNEEISQLKAMTKSQFVPIEIYNDEKRQYIIEQLQRVNCPFVEENNAIYVPEYYVQSVRKALAAFKPMNEQTYRERLKFFIDRLIYLCKARKIDSKIVSDLAHNGLLYQDKRGNAVFLHIDDNGEILGAELQGTNTYQRFKGVAAGTADSVFSLKVGTPNKVYVFESAIDLLSFRQLASPNKLQDSVLVSMAGLKPSTLKNFEERGLPFYACVDNDEAGSRFISENNLIPCNKVLADSGVKDFNELLQKTVHTRELIDKSQSAQNLPAEPSKVKPPPHSHKGRR